MLHTHIWNLNINEEFFLIVFFFVDQHESKEDFDFPLGILASEIIFLKFSPFYLG